MSGEVRRPDEAIERDDGSIAWAVRQFAAAAAANDHETVRQVLALARERIHSANALLSDILGELRFAEGARLAMIRGTPMRGEYEDALMLAAEYLQAVADTTRATCLAPASSAG